MQHIITYPLSLVELSKRLEHRLRKVKKCKGHGKRQLITCSRNGRDSNFRALDVESEEQTHFSIMYIAVAEGSL